MQNTWLEEAKSFRRVSLVSMQRVASYTYWDAWFCGLCWTFCSLRWMCPPRFLLYRIVRFISYASMFVDKKEKKPEYKPYTLRDYRKMPKEVRLGTLGPDLDTEEFRSRVGASMFIERICVLQITSNNFTRFFATWEVWGCVWYGMHWAASIDTAVSQKLVFINHCIRRDPRR